MKFVNEIIENIWKDRYRKNEETLDGNLHRVAKFCSTNENEEKEFYDVMNKGLFYPGGRTMSNSGIGSKLTLKSCEYADKSRVFRDNQLICVEIHQNFFFFITQRQIRTTRTLMTMTDG